MLSDRCPVPSVTLVYCGQTVGWIKMKLGMQVGLVPGHIVLDADPAPFRKGTQQPPLSKFTGAGFACVHIIRDQCLLWPNGCMHQHMKLGISVSLFAVARLSVCLSVVCNVRAPYSGGSNFRQYFYGITYLGLGHPLKSTENFTEVVPGEPLRQGS